jgi:hypothetical protein
VSNKSAWTLLLIYQLSHSWLIKELECEASLPNLLAGKTIVFTQDLSSSSSSHL